MRGLEYAEMGENLRRWALSEGLCRCSQMAPGDLCRGMGGRCITIMAFALSDMQFWINYNNFVHEGFRRGSKGYLGDMWFLQWQHGSSKRTCKYRKYTMHLGYVCGLIQ